MLGKGDTDLPPRLVWFVHRKDLRKELRGVSDISEKKCLQRSFTSKVPGMEWQ